MPRLLIFKDMATFLEIFFTSLVTLIAGYLSVKYRPVSKRRRRLGQPIKPVQKTTLKGDYRNYSAKFIVVFLGSLFFSSIFYLLENGYIILKW